MMTHTKYFVFIAITIGLTFMKLGGLSAQFPPQYPQPGHDAISHTDSRIIAWASHCEVYRGYVDIADASLGLVDAGDPTSVLGPSDGMTVSLGDSGVAVITVEVPIVNGDGPDFVIFENAFSNPADNETAYLELAFVEVSNDGVNYFRFPSICMLGLDTQHTNNTYLDAQYIHNLAGKYIRFQGTPFDLEELKNSEGLDVHDIRYIRIVDVIGIINNESWTSLDSEGRMINDPYPTPFNTGGFDLDAVGVINNLTSTQTDYLITSHQVKLYPNPTTDILKLELPQEIHIDDIEIFNILGQKIVLNLISKSERSSAFEWNTQHLNSGIYFLRIKNIVNSFIKQ